MEDIIKLIQIQPDFYAMQGASDDDIRSAENALQLRFATDYYKYAAALAVASFTGHEFTGVCKAKRLNVVTVTREERMYTDVPADWYVIEQTHIDGIVIWQDSAGIVYQTSPDAIAIKLCDSLAEYIEMSLSL